MADGVREDYITLKAIFTKRNQEATEIVDGEVEWEDRNTIPKKPEDMFLEVQKWIRVPNVCVIFIDMVNSSQIDYQNHRRTSAKIYETFTGSLVRVLQRFSPAYIEIQGDGAFGIFDGPCSYAKGFIAAMTFKTYVSRFLSPKIEKKTNEKVSIKTKIGLSYGDIIVKRVGTRKDNNAVWAYHSVNQAAKLASIAQEDDLVVSEEAYEELSKIEWIELSCGCKGGKYTGDRIRLWKEVEDERLRPPVVASAYEIGTCWCKKHGEEYLNNIIDECDLDLPNLSERKD